MTDSSTPTRRRVLTLGAAAGLAAALPGRAFAAYPKPVLSDRDRADLARVQQYLDGIRTMQARFDQVSGEGQPASGTILLQRPGRMRIVYDPPMKVTIVSDGSNVYYYDAALDQVNDIGLEDTPAWFLLRDRISLDGDVTLVQFVRQPGALRLAMVQTHKPDSGYLSITLTDAPLELRQWTVVDAQSKRVTVTLNNARFGVAIDPRQFVWNGPQGARKF